MEVNLLKRERQKGRDICLRVWTGKAESSDVVVKRVDTRTFMPSHFAHHLSMDRGLTVEVYFKKTLRKGGRYPLVAFAV